jgi:hypothetical protein
MEHTQSHVQPRAPRLQLRAPIAFRTSPSGTWAEGWTIDISRSGVLFTVDSPIPGPAADLEFVINLSGGALQGPGVPLLPNLHCRGRVVRTAATAEGQPAVAASIRRQWVRRS